MTEDTIAIIVPAYKAEATLPATLRSVLAQTYPHWEVHLVADDGADYEAFLAATGLRDARFRFLSSGGISRGASNARNVALQALTTPYAAVLDADDRFKPDKLARAVAALEHHAIVTCALDVMTDDFRHLRFVGDGPDRVLRPGEHKFVSLSMDSMLVWDRRQANGRYDATMSNMTDLEFLLQLYRSVPTSFHIGTPAHDYIKRTGSMSNGADTTRGMIASKREILGRLEAGHYGLPEEDVEGLADFLRISLQAEQLYGDALAHQPGLLFEDHLQPLLQTKTAAR